MADNKSKEITIIEKIRSCIEELGLPILDEQIEGEHPFVRAEHRFGPFSIDILTELVPTQGIVCVEIAFSHGVDVNKLEKILDVNNRINNDLMDIAATLVNPNTGQIFVRYGINIPDGHFDREQFIESLKRTLYQAHAVYGMIVVADLADFSAEKIVCDYIKDAKQYSHQMKTGNSTSNHSVH